MINCMKGRSYKERLKELDSFGIKMKKLMILSLPSRSSSITVPRSVLYMQKSI